ncbi:uncharacterized, partial [Tachysurus ichikawai]
MMERVNPRIEQRLALEKEELRIHLQASKEAQRQLTAELALEKEELRIHLQASKEAQRQLTAE